MSFVLRQRRARQRSDDAATVLDRRLFREYGPAIRRGPFRGVIYDARVITHTTAVASKLFGAYESEIHLALEHVLASDMSMFVDIGCAEGHYVAGVARRRPDVEVVAIDVDPAARQMCRITARANHANVQIRASATPEYLSTLPSGTVVFSDCEGAEGELLDPSRAPVLSTLPLLVEVHDFLRPGISELLVDRFAPTHRIEKIVTQPRDASRFEELKDLGPLDQALALSEGRPANMMWLFMQPV